jgi:hypothetical protein
MHKAFWNFSMRLEKSLAFNTRKVEDNRLYRILVEPNPQYLALNFSESWFK